MEATSDSHKIFTFDKITVFFKHTDYHGFVHGYNYLEWMSYAREAFFQSMVNNFQEVCERSVKMVTTQVEFEQQDDAVFGDEIEFHIYSQRVRRSSFDVIFQVYRKKDRKKLGLGRQTLAFLDASTGRLTEIPSELKEPVKRLEKT